MWNHIKWRRDRWQRREWRKNMNKASTPCISCLSSLSTHSSHTGTQRLVSSSHSLCNFSLSIPHPSARCCQHPAVLEVPSWGVPHPCGTLFPDPPSRHELGRTIWQRRAGSSRDEESCREWCRARADRGPGQTWEKGREKTQRHIPNGEQDS